MNRWNWVAIRSYWRAAFSLLVTVVSAVVLSEWQASPLLAGFMVIVRWPLLTLAATFALVLASMYRLMQWQRGQGLDWPCYGGPLVHERTGYLSRGGAYRRCYACGGDVNHRYYE